MHIIVSYRMDRYIVGIVLASRLNLARNLAGQINCDISETVLHAGMQKYWQMRLEFSEQNANPKPYFIRQMFNQRQAYCVLYAHKWKLHQTSKVVLWPKEADKMSHFRQIVAKSDVKLVVRYVSIPIYPCVFTLIAAERRRWGSLTSFPAAHTNVLYYSSK